MLTTRAMKSLDERHSGLHEALLAEFEAMRADVPNWGLDPLGMDRVLAAVARFEASTAVDMATWQLRGVDVRMSLAARLENARELRLACIDAVDRARKCEWLKDLLSETEAVGGSGLLSAWEPKSSAMA